MKEIEMLRIAAEADCKKFYGSRDSDSQQVFVQGYNQGLSAAERAMRESEESIWVRTFGEECVQIQGFSDMGLYGMDDVYRSVELNYLFWLFDSEGYDTFTKKSIIERAQDLVHIHDLAYNTKKVATCLFKLDKDGVNIYSADQLIIELIHNMLTKQQSDKKVG